MTFEDAGGSFDDQLDAAYRAKYGRHADRIVDSITSPRARSTTLRLVPRSTGTPESSDLGLGIRAADSRALGLAWPRRAVNQR